MSDIENVGLIFLLLVALMVSPFALRAARCVSAEWKELLREFFPPGDDADGRK